jgi:hypothetical protein
MSLAFWHPIRLLRALGNRSRDKHERKTAPQRRVQKRDAATRKRSRRHSAFFELP